MATVLLCRADWIASLGDDLVFLNRSFNHVEESDWPVDADVILESMP